MKLQFRFNPALRRDLAPSDRRRWFFRSIALRIDPHAIPIWTFEVFWKRLLLGSIGALFACYLLLVSVLALWLSRSSHNQVGWRDLAAAPVKWKELQVKRGDSSIELAKEKLEQSDYVEGYYHLRVGLARAPANIQGRVLLAQLYSVSDPAQALATMEEGLKHSANDVVFLRALFTYYSQLQVRTRALAMMEKLLDDGRRPPLSREAKLFVQLSRAALLNECGDPAAADKILSSVESPANAADRLWAYRQHIEVLTKLGRVAEIARLPRPEGATEDGNVATARAQAELALTNGDAASLETALRRLRAAAPTQPASYLFAFQAWHQIKRYSLREMAEREYFSVFGADDVAMQLFAATAVNLGLPDVVQRAMEAAQANGRSVFAYRVHLTELALRRGDIDEAMRLLRLWENEIATVPQMQRLYPDFISRLTRAVAAGGEEQEAGLVNHVGTMRGRAGPRVYVMAASVLERAGRIGAANQVILIGARLYPHSDPVIEASRRLGEQFAQLAAAKSVRSVAPTVELPATGAEALQKVDALITKDADVAAREFLRALRAAKPAWLAAIEPELALRDVEVGLATQDRLAARAIVRAYLDKYRGDDEALKLVRLAETLLTRKRVVEARVIHDEVAAVRGSSTAVAFALRGLNLGDDLAPLVVSADTALKQLDRDLAQSRHDDALRKLEYIRQKTPAWLTDARNELLVREVRIRLALGQRPSALTALKDLAQRSGVPRGMAFRVVRDLLAAGEQEHALLLAREIVRLLPGDPAAAKLLKEAETPRPAA